MSWVKEYWYSGNKGKTLWESLDNYNLEKLWYKIFQQEYEYFMSEEWDDEWKEFSTECPTCHHKPHTRYGETYTRELWAAERAENSTNIILEEVNKEDDDEVAQFFNIEKGYDYVDEYNNNIRVAYNDKNIIGKCIECGFPLRKNDINNFETYKEKEEANSIGVCPCCENEFDITSITDKEFKVIIKI